MQKVKNPILVFQTVFSFRLRFLFELCSLLHYHQAWTTGRIVARRPVERNSKRHFGSCSSTLPRISLSNRHPRRGQKWVGPKQCQNERICTGSLIHFWLASTQFLVETSRRLEPLPERFPTWRVDCSDGWNWIWKNNIPLRVLYGSVQSRNPDNVLLVWNAGRKNFKVDVGAICGVSIFWKSVIV